MRILYTLSIHFYHFAICVASLFNPKAALWLKGRKNIFRKLEAEIIKNSTDKLAWFHCASLGEFEQGRSLIEKYKSKNPSHKVLLTFFSPSGYEIRKNYAVADFVFYLPIDTPANAKRFLEIVKPDVAFFVKYEFWFSYLNELKNRAIPVYLVSGIFRDDHHFFKRSGSWFRKQLSCFSYFFLQNEKSMELLNSIGYKNAMVTGDTRFDRVWEVVQNVREVDVVKQFALGKVMVAGSTWEEDEKILADYFTEKNAGKLVVAPHEVHEGHILSIEKQFEKKCVRYSEATNKNTADANVLIVDNIGMLSSLYQYGTVAYIGGGFGKGIHNILEAAAFGMPVIFGPNYHKFDEAKDLIKLGGAFEIKTLSDLKNIMELLNDEQVLKTASQISKMYVQGKIGASEKILNAIRLK